MTDQVDAIIIGGGIVGLAVARALAMAGREALVLEAEARLASHASARNSEVVHAGLYYPTGSNKARLCVAGKALLYDYAARHQVAHRRIGKYIVATNGDEEAALHALARQAESNGVADLCWADKARLRDEEPALHAVAALFSPSTGIIDSHGFALALEGDIADHGGLIARNCRFARAAATGRGFAVRAAETSLSCRWLVNAAGLWAETVARSIDGLARARIPKQHLAKGHYAALTGGAAPFRHLIYPLPDAVGLGIHATLDIGGQCRFGPDSGEWLERIDYGFTMARLATFYPAVRRYWPGLPDGALAPGYSGIRARLAGPGAPPGDFLIEGPAQHGLAGFINLMGIESPGLTAALAIAEEVKAMMAA
ncbi:MAG: NAD(P)/FAD-dependent oxidoreductase [Pseudomonadota bacterium]